MDFLFVLVELSSIYFWIVKDCFCFSYVYALSLMFLLFFCNLIFLYYPKQNPH